MHSYRLNVDVMARSVPFIEFPTISNNLHLHFAMSLIRTSRYSRHKTTSCIFYMHQNNTQVEGRDVKICKYALGTIYIGICGTFTLLGAIGSLLGALLFLRGLGYLPRSP